MAKHFKLFKDYTTQATWVLDNLQNSIEFLQGKIKKLKFTFNERIFAMWVYDNCNIDNIPVLNEFKYLSLNICLLKKVVKNA